MAAPLARLPLYKSPSTSATLTKTPPITQTFAIPPLLAPEFTLLLSPLTSLDILSCYAHTLFATTL